MPYNITLTNGTPLLTLPDGTRDATTTSVNLVGRNFTGFGLYVNENFVKLLENCSSATAPTNPLIGQLWWDSASKHLNVWQGINWKVISSSQTGTTPPIGPVTGDFWWNTSVNQFSVYNGTQWIAIGPSILPGTVLTTIVSNAVSDGSTTHTVGNVVVNNKLTGVFSSDATAFTPVPAISGLPVIRPGLNMTTGLSAPTITSNVIQSNSATISGNLVAGNLVVSGEVILGNVSFESAAVFGNLAANLVPSANLTYNIGSISSWWNNIYGTSIHAQYADLAERFEADTEYDPGTVVELGGAAEITAVVDELSDNVFGVISTNAAFVMNSRAGDNITHPPVAASGRVPVKVVGKINKGDRLVSAGKGVARAGKKEEITAWNVIGRSLENKDSLDEGFVEAVVKLNS
jgi:hypothetical protein